MSLKTEDTHEYLSQDKIQELLDEIYEKQGDISQQISLNDECNKVLSLIKKTSFVKR